MFSLWRAGMAVGLGTALILPAMAADESATKDRPVQGAANATAQTDSQLASCLVIDNEGEVAIGKFAKEKSETKAVQEFAQMTIDDHTKFLGKLQKFGSASTRPATGTAADGTAHLGLNFLAIKRELANQCQATIERELGQKEGSEFDKCYLTQQMMAHMHMWDTLTVFKKHATPEFAEVLDEGLKTTEMHLNQAKKLAKQFEGAPKTASRQ